MATEDAACLGIVFSDKFFNGDIKEALQIYEQVRKPRANRVQEASVRARGNFNERAGKMLSLPGEVWQANLAPLLGYSSNTNSPIYKVANEAGKLTIEELHT